MSIMTAVPGILASGGAPLVSPYTWTSRTMNSSEDFRGVAYDGSTYWAAVTTGSGTADIVTSTDGITWTLQESSRNTMRDIDNDGTYFTTVGDSGYMLTATDPTGTWTARTSGFGSTNIGGVFYDGVTYWLAMGSSGKLTTATDPTGTWTSRTSSFGSTGLRSAAFDGTTYVTVGETGKLATATDPTSTWTQRTSSFGTTRIRFITCDGVSMFVAVGNSGKIAYSTTPTSTWTQATSPFSGSSIITTVQWDPAASLFVAVSNLSEIAISENGIAWQLDTGGFSNMWDLYAGDSFLVVVGNGGAGKTSFS